MKSYFSLPYNTKSLIPSYTVINPSILLNLLRSDLESIKLLNKML